MITGGESPSFHESTQEGDKNHHPGKLLEKAMAETSCVNDIYHLAATEVSEL